MLRDIITVSCGYFDRTDEGKNCYNENDGMVGPFILPEDGSAPTDEAVEEFANLMEEAMWLRLRMLEFLKKFRDFK